MRETTLQIKIEEIRKLAGKDYCHIGIGKQKLLMEKVVAIYPEMKELGKSHREMAMLLNLPFHYINKYGRYGMSGINARVLKEARKRDNFTCQTCGERDEFSVHAHHIHSARNSSLRNLVTLCPQCHRQAEKIKKNNPEQYKILANCWITA